MNSLNGVPSRPHLAAGSRFSLGRRRLRGRVAHPRGQIFFADGGAGGEDGGAREEAAGQWLDAVDADLPRSVGAMTGRERPSSKGLTCS